MLNYKPNLPDATELLKQIKEDKITPEQLVAKHLEVLESNQSKLNGAVKIFHKEAENELKNLPSGPLTGIPISIKECYAIKGEYITSGSKRMPPLYQDKNSSVVQRLKDAGAVIVARSNTSEFLLGRETNNLVYGRTNNPINPVLTAGGSSGGEGALVGSGSTVFGIGTDIGGSVRYPSAFCGLVGFKPASGNIDKTGIFPVVNHFAETMNSPGTITRSVRDARLVYNVIANKPLQEKREIAGGKLLTPIDFQVKIEDASISNALTSSVKSLKNLEVQKTDISIPESGMLFNWFMSLMIDAFMDNIYKWSITAEGKELSFFPELLRQITKKPTLSKDMFNLLMAVKIIKPSKSKVEKIINEVKKLREKYYNILNTDGILILPTCGVIALPHGVFNKRIGKPGIIKIITPVSFCNILNLSCITIPAWKFVKDSHSSPPGIMLAAAPGMEGLLLDTAEALESLIA